MDNAPFQPVSVDPGSLDRVAQRALWVSRRRGIFWDMRIAFLFNHDQIHPVAHSLPIALELAAAALDAEIVIAVTNARSRAEVVRLAGRAIDDRLQLVLLSLRKKLSRLAARLAYEAQQKRLFAASFDLTAEPSSRRAAQVVAGTTASRRSQRFRVLPGISEAVVHSVCHTDPSAERHGR